MDSYPLDVIEVISVDEDRVDSGRPIGFLQGHGQLFRLEHVSFAAEAAIDKSKESADSCGAQ